MTPPLLAPIHNEYAQIGTRFMVRRRRRWHVYTVCPFGDRLVGVTWFYRTAERWLRP